MAKKNKNKKAPSVAVVHVKTQLVKPADTIRQVLFSEGLHNVVLSHKTKETTAEFGYTGPKISREVWDEIVAFMQYSQRVTHSEAQLRLFVNPRLGIWKGWAFPQICGTGMTTREIEDTTPERTEQRAQFKDSEGWMPYGTVHHHCSGGAFQSGTDENDEVKQDGLHITLGNIGADVHSIDCRFYVKGNKFNPDMSLFFSVDDKLEEVKALPDYARMFLPADLLNQLARREMCEPVEDDEAFPPKWKENLVERKIEVPRSYQPQFGHMPGSWNAGGSNYPSQFKSEKFPKYSQASPTGVISREDGHKNVTVNCAIDFNRALDSIRAYLEEEFDTKVDITDKAILDIVEDLDSTIKLSQWPLFDLLATMYINDCTPDAFLDFMIKRVEGNDKAKDKAPAASNGKATTSTVITPYDADDYTHMGFHGQ